MVSLNKIEIIGNVGKEPEMRFVPNGSPVVSFSVAVNDQFGENKTTEWFNVITWDKLAETCNQYVTKGMLVFVEGRQQTSKWDDKEGNTHYKTELIANRVLFLSRKENVDE